MKVLKGVVFRIQTIFHTITYRKEKMLQICIDIEDKIKFVVPPLAIYTTLFIAT